MVSLADPAAHLDLRINHLRAIANSLSTILFAQRLDVDGLSFALGAIVDHIRQRKEHIVKRAEQVGIAADPEGLRDALGDTPSRTTPRQEPRAVACAIAQKRHRRHADRCDHQLAFLSVRHWQPIITDDLRYEMILSHMHAVKSWTRDRSAKAHFSGTIMRVER